MLTPAAQCIVKAINKRREERIIRERPDLPAHQLDISLVLLPTEESDFYDVAQAVDMTYNEVKTLYYGYGPWKEA